MAVVPVAKALYLCDDVDTEGGKVDLYGLFNSIRAARFPHVARGFKAFAQLGQGLGDVPLHFDIRRATDGLLVHATETRSLHFPARDRLMQVEMSFEAVEFPTAGVYLVELVCDNTWVADVTLRVREVPT